MINTSINTALTLSLPPHNPEKSSRLSFGASTPTYCLYLNETQQPEVGFFAQAVNVIRKGLFSKRTEKSANLAPEWALVPAKQEDTGYSLNFWV